MLDERVADGADAVVDGEGDQPVAVALQRVARCELDDVEPVRETSEDAAQVAEEPACTRRPVHGDRQLAAAQSERLEHSGQAEEVVGVEVGEEHLLEVDEPDVGAQELPLRALGAVDEEPLAAAPDQGRGRRSLCGRRRPGRPEEHDVEVHSG